MTVGEGSATAAGTGVNVKVTVGVGVTVGAITELAAGVGDCRTDDGTEGETASRVAAGVADASVTSDGVATPAASAATTVGEAAGVPGSAPTARWPSANAPVPPGTVGAG